MECGSPYLEHKFLLALDIKPLQLHLYCMNQVNPFANQPTPRPRRCCRILIRIGDGRITSATCLSGTNSFAATSIPPPANVAQSSQVTFAHGCRYFTRTTYPRYLQIKNALELYATD
jgi:hypothetical protein